MRGAAIRWILPIMLWTVLGACANIVPPTGGDKDVTPPKLLAVTPADSQLNTRVKKIVLDFDEYITLSDASTQIQISPLLSLPLTITSTNKHVTVVIPDSLLQDETTYRITFGNAIRDLHEGNVYESQGYTFSTGAHFDSLVLLGSVYSANTGRHDSTAQVLLYSALESDSAIVRHKPMYVVHADNSGNFAFRGLPARPFRIYALRDANSNLTFDGGSEWIAFNDSIVTPAPIPHKDIELRTFPESLGDTATSAQQARQSARLFDREASPSAAKAATVQAGSYKLSVDTSDVKRRTQELNEPVVITFGRRLAAPVKEDRIFLSYDSAGTTIEVPFKVSAADTSFRHYNITTPWREDALYTLRLQKGFAKDSTGTDMMPGRFTFRTKRDEDYGKLRIHLPTRYYGRSHILQVVSDHDTIYQQPVTDTMISLLHIQPGSYTFRIIEDRNENGRWDAGDLFLRRQPELVIPYNNNINLKAGWEQQIDFEEPRKPGTEAASPKSSLDSR
jgi:hypothetical protein